MNEPYLSSHEVAKVLEFQLQHHSFQRNPKAGCRDNQRAITVIPKKQPGPLIQSLGHTLTQSGTRDALVFKTL